MTTPPSESQFFAAGDAEGESFDQALFNSLRAQYSAEMSVSDMLVCREIYMNWRDEHPSHYDEIVARLLHSETFPTELDIYDAIHEAHKKGLVRYELNEWSIAKHAGACTEFVHVPEVDVKLREDIFDALHSTELGLNAQYKKDFDITDLLKT